MGYGPAHPGWPVRADAPQATTDSERRKVLKEIDELSEQLSTADTLPA